MTDKLIVRGRKEICALMNVQDWRTAVKEAIRLKISFVKGNPSLSVEVYREAIKKQNNL